MLPYFSEIYGNASSNHSYGRKAKQAVEIARKQVSDIIDVSPSEIFFTSGATESINWAIKGYAETNRNKCKHIVTVKTEHKAVLNTCEYLETIGYEVDYLNVDSNGMINLKELENSIREDTALVCVMYVNNEIGVIQDIKGIGTICKSKNVCFFCDATQAVGKVKVDIIEEHIDLLAFSGHKMNGPKGIGALYKKSNIKISPLIHGGSQEKGLRGGTYNTPLIVGFGEACRIANLEFDDKVEKWNKLRKEVEQEYEKNGTGIVNFKDVKTAPHIMSITLNDENAEDFLLKNAAKFVASTGSACNAALVEESHVLFAIGCKAENTYRISF